LLIAGGAYLIFRKREAWVAEEAAATGQPVESARARRFEKSRTDRKLFGVCGGLADYFEVDPTLIRLAVAGVTLAAPPFGIIGYLALAIFAPTAPIVAPPPQSTASTS
jgi:phage shock protein C